MDEKTARTRWCPMARVAGNMFDSSVGTEYEFSGSNRFGNPFNQAPIELQQATRCIASDCMMWREETATNCNTGENRVCGGHCGLGGKP